MSTAIDALRNGYLAKCDAVSFPPNSEFVAYLDRVRHRHQHAASTSRMRSGTDFVELRYSGDAGPLSRTGCNCLAEALRQNATIQVLDLPKNKIEDEGLASLCHALKHRASSLHVFNIAENNIAGKSIHVFIDYLYTCDALHTLNFRGNKLAPAAGSRLLRALCSNICLRKLDLTQCGLTHECATAVSDLLELNSTLEELSLGYNKLGDKFLERSWISFCKNRRIRSLDLSSCQIGFTGARFLAHVLQKNRFLVRLQLDFNPISKTLQDRIQNLLRRNASQDRTVADVDLVPVFSADPLSVSPSRTIFSEADSDTCNVSSSPSSSPRPQYAPAAAAAAAAIVVGRSRSSSSLFSPSPAHVPLSPGQVELEESRGIPSAASSVAGPFREPPSPSESAASTPSSPTIAVVASSSPPGGANSPLVPPPMDDLTGVDAFVSGSLRWIDRLAAGPAAMPSLDRGRLKETLTVLGNALRSAILARQEYQEKAETAIFQLQQQLVALHEELEDREATLVDLDQQCASATVLSASLHKQNDELRAQVDALSKQLIAEKDRHTKLIEQIGDTRIPILDRMVSAEKNREHQQPSGPGSLLTRNNTSPGLLVASSSMSSSMSSSSSTLSPGNNLSTHPSHNHNHNHSASNSSNSATVNHDAELLRCENRLLAEALLETQRQLRGYQQGLLSPSV